jgi:hypothetical protein
MAQKKSTWKGSQKKTQKKGKGHKGGKKMPTRLKL